MWDRAIVCVSLRSCAGGLHSQGAVLITDGPLPPGVLEMSCLRRPVWLAFYIPGFWGCCVWCVYNDSSGLWPEDQEQVVPKPKEVSLPVKLAALRSASATCCYVCQCEHLKSLEILKQAWSSGNHFQYCWTTLGNTHLSTHCCEAGMGWSHAVILEGNLKCPLCTVGWKYPLQEFPF